MNKDEALNGLKHLETIASQLKTYSDQGQYLNIPSHLSAGNCWRMAKEIENVINACKEALEQPPQEPYGWMFRYVFKSSDTCTDWKFTFNPVDPHPTIETMAVYTHPHQWQGLTDDEKLKGFKANHCDDLEDAFMCGVQYAEVMLKEKNT